MTEYEINKAVAEKLDIDIVIMDEGYLLLCDKDGSVCFDPCNDAKQAWEIMLANDIGITQCLRDDDYCAYRGLWGVSDSFDPDYLMCNREFFFNSKPFVAAMLLFLEI